MGLFDFLKKKAPATKQPRTTKLTANSSKEPLDRLTKEGELPWGWVYRNKDFTERIRVEFLHFLDVCKDSQSKSPKEQYQALKSLVLYLEDVEKLCRAKGECYEFWFYELLITRDYIATQKSQLEELLCIINNEGE